MHPTKMFVACVSGLLLCGAVGVFQPVESAALGKFKDKFVTNKELKKLILMLKTQVANLPQGEPCAVPPTWSEVFPGNERFVPTTFVDANGDPAAYCDRETGNVWEAVPSSGTFIWGDEEELSDAQRYCLNRIVGTNGQKGWRLPSIAELASLVDVTSTSCTVDNLCIPDGSPFDIEQQLLVFWSATEFTGNPASAWIVGFFNGDVDSIAKGFSERAWCMRGATDADAY